MNIFDKCEAALRKVRRAKVAKLGSYHYADGAAIKVIENVPLTQGSTRTEVDDGELIVQSKVIDFIVDVADLTFDADFAGARSPKAGDLIVFGGCQFEVCSIGGQKPWGPHGRDGKSIRIHTRSVKKNEPDENCP